jgi:hypothetical protein
MSEENTTNAKTEDLEFNVALGWLAALSVSIAALASFAS